MKTLKKRTLLLICSLFLTGCTSVSGTGSSFYIGSSEQIHTINLNNGTLSVEESKDFSSRLLGKEDSSAYAYSSADAWYIRRTSSGRAWIEKISKSTEKVKTLSILETSATSLSEKGICTTGFFNKLQFDTYDLDLEPSGTYTLDYFSGYELVPRTIHWVDGSYYLLISVVSGHNWYDTTENHLLQLSETFELEQAYDLGVYEGVLTDFVPVDGMLYFVQNSDGYLSSGAASYSGKVFCFDLKQKKMLDKTYSLAYRYPQSVYASADGLYLIIQHNAYQMASSRPFFTILSLKDGTLVYPDFSDDMFWGVDSNTDVYVASSQSTIFLLTGHVLTTLSLPSLEQKNFDLTDAGIDDPSFVFVLSS